MVKVLSMTIQVNVLEAKPQLSRLLDCAEAGEDVVIARAEHSVSRPAAIQNYAAEASRVLGAIQGKGWIADDFDAHLPEDFLFDPEAAH